MEILVEDYLKNKCKCKVCGEKRFFSHSNEHFTTQLICAECDARYTRADVNRFVYIGAKP